MTPTPKPLTEPVASIAIDFVARTITLTPLLGAALSLPVEPSGVQIAIASGYERPKFTVPVRDLSYYNEIPGLKNRSAARGDASKRQ